MSIVFFGGVLKSFNQGLLGAALAFMSIAPGVSTRFIALFAGIGAVAQILSSLVVGWVAERFGFGRTLRLTAVVAVLSVVLFCLPGGSAPWLCGNVVKGMYFGVVAAFLPVVLSVVVPQEKVGRASGLFQLSQHAGGILGALSGAAVAWGFDSDPLAALRVDFLLMALPAALFAASLKGMRELPLTRPPADAPSSRCLPACAAAVVFMVLMSACGVGTVREYLAVVFVRRGLALADSCSISAVVSSVSVAAVVLSTALAGRMSAFHRVAIGAVGMAIGLSGAAFANGFPFVAFLSLASVSFAFGPGACAWGIVPQLMPPPFRTRGTSAAIVAGQLVSLVLTTSFLPVLDRVGLSACLVAFAIMSALMAVVAALLRGGKAGLE